MDIITLNEDNKSKLFELNVEYIDWGTKNINQHYGVEFIPLNDDYEENLREYARGDVENYSKIEKSNGLVALLHENNEYFGMGLIKKLDEQTAEIKRMYIKKHYRGKGYGNLLLEFLIKTAEELKYKSIKLDSANFMHRAHQLYKKYGFENCEPYPESEIAQEMQKYWIFMEKQLG